MQRKLLRLAAEATSLCHRSGELELKGVGAVQKLNPAAATENRVVHPWGFTTSGTKIAESKHVSSECSDSISILARK
ncbi:unnamed protein product [Victoria cruziana]